MSKDPVTKTNKRNRQAEPEDSTESPPPKEYQTLHPRLVRRGSVSLYCPNAVATSVNKLRVAVWNVQDFGSGPSGMWAVDLNSDWTDDNINTVTQWLQTHFPSSFGVDKEIIDITAADDAMTDATTLDYPVTNTTTPDELMDDVTALNDAITNTTTTDEAMTDVTALNGAMTNTTTTDDLMVDDTMANATILDEPSPDQIMRSAQHSDDAKLRKILRKKKPLGLEDRLVPLVRRLIFEQRVMGIERYCAATKAEVFIILEAQTRASRQSAAAPKDVTDKDVAAYDDWAMSRPYLEPRTGWGNIIQLYEKKDKTNTVFPNQKGSKQKALWHHYSLNQAVLSKFEDNNIEQYSQLWDAGRIAKYKGSSGLAFKSDYIKWIDDELWSAAEEVSDACDTLQDEYDIASEDLRLANMDLNKNYPIIPATKNSKKARREEASRRTTKRREYKRKNGYLALEQNAKRLKGELDEQQATLAWMVRVQRNRQNTHNCEYAFEACSGRTSNLPAILTLLNLHANTEGWTWCMGPSDGYGANGETILVRIPQTAAPLAITTVKLENPQDERPAWKFIYKGITLLAIHAPAPGRIPTSGGWFTSLDKAVKECHPPTIVLGDFNTSQKAIKKYKFLKTWFGDYSPALDTHENDRTSVRAWTNKKDDFRSEAYDKILYNTRHSTAVKLSLTPIENPDWLSAAAVRRYSDHMFRCADATYSPLGVTNTDDVEMSSTPDESRTSLPESSNDDDPEVRPKKRTRLNSRTENESL